MGSAAKTPFLDSPADLEKRIDRLIGHFRHAEWLFYQSSKKGVPTARDLLWILLQDAMATARSMPFTELRRLSAVRTVMPGARITPAEFYEMRLARLQARMDEYDLATPRETVNAAAVDRMVDVLDLMRFVTRPKGNADRFRRVCLARAAGMSLERCGRIFARSRVDFDRRAMHDIKDLVLGQIFSGIETHFGLKRTTRGFRRLTVREIERQQRARKRAEREATG